MRRAVVKPLKRPKTLCGAINAEGSPVRLRCELAVAVVVQLLAETFVRPEDITVGFADIGGLQDIKEALVLSDPRAMTTCMLTVAEDQSQAHTALHACECS